MKELIIIFLLFSCGRQADRSDQSTLNDKPDNELYSLLEKLPNLRTPLTFRSDKQIISDGSLTRNDELIEKIRVIDPSFNPYGKIYQTNDFIAVIAIGAADIALPILVTFDKKGNIIDSFNMYPDAGADMGYYSTNMVTLTKSKEVFLTDSTVRRKINAEGTDEIPGTDSLSITRKHFRLNDKGKIEEIR
jgi:hypothetical protein